MTTTNDPNVAPDGGRRLTGRHVLLIALAFFGPIPGTSATRWGSRESTVGVRMPKWSTSRLARAGPTPFTPLEAR